MSGSILRRFAADVAALVAETHRDDPLGELVLWLHMALRREASVGEIYGVANLERRLAGLLAPRSLVGVIRTIISSVWAQERGHAAYLEAVLGSLASHGSVWPRAAARLEGLMGAMEGVVLSAKTSPSPLERVKAALLLAIGRRVQDVPEFVSALSRLTFGEFCRFNADLEVTAVHGYERMLVLLDALPAGDALVADSTLAVDVGRMIVDERFHNEIFLAIAGWFTPGEQGDHVRLGLAVEQCSAELAAVRERVYGAATPLDAGVDASGGDS